MMEVADSIILIFSALFPIVNPLGGSPIFLAVTNDYSTPERRTLARRVAFNSFFLLVGSYLIGTHILTFFGISLPVVQVGGGLVVISTGWAMLKSREEEERKERHRNVKPQDTFRQAFYPLTLPLTVGPGSISVAITLGANAPRHYGINLRADLAALVGLALIALTIFVCYGFADRMARILGATGMTVMMRLTSFLLVCIGVEIFWNGAKALLASVPVNLH